MDRHARCIALEQKHVYDVYDNTAHYFRDVRYKAWPKVRHFLMGLEPASLVADVGCGSGKYLHINKETFKISCDHSSLLVNIARGRQHEVLTADNLRLPYRDNIFDAVISIGVIHHLTTRERRIQALKELARILCPGGKLMVYVWAMEQRHRKFNTQDVLIPWHLQPKQKFKKEASRAKFSRKDFSISSVSDDESQNDPNRSTSPGGRHARHKSSGYRPIQVDKCKTLKHEDLGSASGTSQSKCHQRRKSYQKQKHVISSHSRDGDTSSCASNNTSLDLEALQYTMGNFGKGSAITQNKGSKIMPGASPGGMNSGFKSRVINFFSSAFSLEIPEPLSRKKCPSKVKDSEYKRLIEQIMREDVELFTHQCHLLEHSESVPETDLMFAVREFPQSSQTSLRKVQSLDTEGSSKQIKTSTLTPLMFTVREFPQSSQASLRKVQSLDTSTLRPDLGQHSCPGGHFQMDTKQCYSLQGELPPSNMTVSQAMIQPKLALQEGEGRSSPSTTQGSADISSRKDCLYSSQESKSNVVAPISHIEAVLSDTQTFNGGRQPWHYSHSLVTAKESTHSGNPLDPNVLSQSRSHNEKDSENNGFHSVSVLGQQSCPAVIGSLGNGLTIQNGQHYPCHQTADETTSGSRAPRGAAYYDVVHVNNAKSNSIENVALEDTELTRFSDISDTNMTLGSTGDEIKPRTFEVDAKVVDQKQTATFVITNGETRHTMTLGNGTASSANGTVPLVHVNGCSVVPTSDSSPESPGLQPDGSGPDGSSLSSPDDAMYLADHQGVLAEVEGTQYTVLSDSEADEWAKVTVKAIQAMQSKVFECVGSSTDSNISRQAVIGSSIDLEDVTDDDPGSPRWIDRRAHPHLSRLRYLQGSEGSSLSSESELDESESPPSTLSNQDTKNKVSNRFKIINDNLEMEKNIFGRSDVTTNQKVSLKMSQEDDLIDVKYELSTGHGADEETQLPGVRGVKTCPEPECILQTPVVNKSCDLIATINSEPSLPPTATTETSAMTHGGESGQSETTYHRYYHVFREGELAGLIERNLDCLHVYESYYDNANWCVVAEKVQVWKI